MTQSAEELETMGEYRRAYLAYMSEAEALAKPAAAYFRAGLLASRLENTIGAVRAFELAVSTPGAVPNYWYYYARSLHRIEDPYRARYAYQQYAQRRTKKGGRVFHHRGGLLPFRRGVRYGAVRRPEYAHSMLHAADLARVLGEDRIRVAEFGVASGQGLLAAQDHAHVVEELTGVVVELWGFDTGEGIPESDDHRDLRHYFGPGDYAMQDRAALEARLERGQLVLGDAQETVSAWIAEGPPIGALLFDMDLYSSTLGVLNHLAAAEDRHFLPRVSLAFDDIGPKTPGFQIKDYSDVTGEAAAIRDFNQGHREVQLAPDKWFTALPDHAPWHDMCYLMHRFEHPSYRTRVRGSASDHMRLRSDVEADEDPAEDPEKGSL